MNTHKKQKRPSYNQVDTEDREAYLGSRTNVLSKSFTTDLWMKVIIRAIDDAALYKFMRAVGKKLKEEEEEYELSAWNFLFNENHKVPMGDYLIDIDCPKCKIQSSLPMSDAAGTDFICDSCHHKVSWKYTTYVVTDTQIIKEITLAELISLWGVEDINGFRDGCRKRINEIVTKKLQLEKNR